MISSRRLVTTAAAVVLAAGITSCSSSSGGSAATTTTAKTAQTTTTTITTDTTTSIANPIVHLTATFTGNNGVDEPITVAFDGAVNDKGTATQTAKDGTQGESGTIVFKLAKGTMEGSFVERDFQMNLDEAACGAAPTSNGTITITSGTGDYVRVTGDLSFTTAGTMVGAKDATGTCVAQSMPPVSSVIVLKAVGPMTFDG